MSAETGIHHNLEIYAQSRPQIPQDLRVGYEDALARVPRWQGANSLKEESDLDHVDAALGIVGEIEQSYPILAQSIELEIVRDILYVHDAGEIIAGDLPRSHPDYENIRPTQKRKEHLGFELLSARIEDPHLRAEARERYFQYEKYKGNDPEAEMAKLIDKMQAFRFALGNVFDPLSIGDRRSEYVRQANESVDLIFKFSSPLFQMLNKEAAHDLYLFLRSEFQKYETASFTEVSSPALRRLHSVISGINRLNHPVFPNGK